MATPAHNEVDLDLAQSTYKFDQTRIWEMIERKDHKILEELGGISGLTQNLNSSEDKGITTDSMDTRIKCFGTNTFRHIPPPTLFELIWEALQDRMMQLLIVAAIVSIIFGMVMEDPHTGEVNRTKGWIEGTAILISVSVVVFIGAGNDYQKAKKFEELSRQQSVKIVQVIRDSEPQSINSTEVVVGDIMILETGMQIVCDGLLLLGQDLKCNESAMTGESDLMKKKLDGDCYLLSGTSVEEGTGKMIVIAVGMNSFQGKMKEKVDEGGMEETPLQIKLADLADKIGKVGAVIAMILFAGLCLKEVIYITTMSGHQASATRFLRFLIVCVTVVVVCIPEGLPLAVTIALAFGMRAMMEDQCMVRILASCETMGAATAICSDKTGTLTTNVMTVVQGYIMGEEFAIDTFGLDPNPLVTWFGRDECKLKTKRNLQEMVAQAISLNSTASEQVRDGKPVWVGNKTEFGLLGFVKRMGYDYGKYRASVKQADLRQYPFSSAKKRMTTIVRNEGKNTCALYCKGASELIVEDCSHIMDADGVPRELDAVGKAHMLDIIQGMANQGNRTIGVAMKQYPAMAEFPEAEPHDHMVLLAVLGIQDPIRDAVPDAVLKCNSAGLIVRMVTGDNINTAIAIARKANLYKDNGWDYAMTGPDFRKMYEENPQKLGELLPRLRVLARSSPTDKYILVHLLQDSGEVVGVTGDGTNDAPALKLSNVGFAMNTGTDIAKGAAHMILMDDNFATVVAAIKWGRAVNDNIRKFLQFQMTVNFAGCLITFIGALASENNEEPLKPVQLLWLNLIMDTLAALALATERPEERSLTRPPVFSAASLLSRKMRGFVVVHGLFQLGVMLGIIFAGHTLFATNDSETSCKANGGNMDQGYCAHGLQHGTIIFNVFIWMQIINELNARKLYGEMNIFEGLVTRSPYLIVVMTIIIGFQIFAVEVAGDFMSTTSLRWQQWLGCIGFALLEFPVGVLQRLIPIEDPIPKEVLQREERDKEIFRKLKFENPDIESPSSMMTSGMEKKGTTKVVSSVDPSLAKFKKEAAGEGNTRNRMMSIRPNFEESMRDINPQIPASPLSSSVNSNANSGDNSGSGGVSELKSWLGVVLKSNHDKLSTEITSLRKEVHEITELRKEVAELRSIVATQQQHAQHTATHEGNPTVPPSN